MKRLTVLLAALLPSLAWAVFPSAESTVVGNDTTNQTAHTLTLPTPITADAAIVCGFSSDSTGSVTWDTATYGAWTQLQDTSGGNFRGVIYGILADGDEDSGTITVTTGNTDTAAWKCASWVDWENDTIANGIECGTAATDTGGTSQNPDPPSLTPSWGSKDTTFMAWAFNNDANTYSVWPLPDNNLQDRANTAGGVAIAFGSDELTNTTLDPTAFTMNNTDNWIAQTCAIEPADAGGDQSAIMRRRR